MKKIISISWLLLLLYANAKSQCIINNLRNANGNFVQLNYECPVSGFSVSGTYNNTTYTGDAWLKPAPGNSITQLRKPLVFVEGLDLNTLDHDTHRHGSRGWPNFISGVASEIDLSDNIFNNLPILLNELNARGYDIFYLDFYDGTAAMQANSMVLVDLLQKINLNYASTANHATVLAGASMGGQIVKYALSYMEKNNLKHCVSEYISIDSPHQGANIPMGMMQMLEHLAPLSAEMQEYKDYLYTPAPMQLLINHPYPLAASYRNAWLADLATVGNYPKFCRKVAISNGSRVGQQLFNAGNRLADFNLYSVSPCNNFRFFDCEIYSNTGSSLLPSKDYDGKSLKGPNALSGVGTALLCEANCLPCITSPSSFYSFKAHAMPAGTPAYDNAPGGKKNSLLKFGQLVDASIGALIQNHTALNWSINSYASAVDEIDHCFIPTISGLDINTNDLFYNVYANMPNNDRKYPGLYPFDAYYAPLASNEYHVEITGDIFHGNIQWTLEELSKSESRLSDVLDNSSPNNGIYNYARTENRFINNLTIQFGGNLFINGSMISDFGVSTSPVIPGGLKLPDAGSELTVETCFCPNSKIEVGNNGSLTLGDNSAGNIGNLILHSGAKLILRTGSTLKINEGSTLTIELGAELIVEPNATILLQGPNALFDVQGTINQITIQSGETFLIDKGAANTGGTLKLSTGSITMQSNSHFVSDNCKVLLNDVILTYNQDADFTLNGENALLEVERTCNVNLSNGHTLLVKKGNSTEGGTLSLNKGVFNLNSNAAVVSQNCKIKLNDYTFNYYHNAQITLNGEQAMLQFGGILNLQAQADLHFSGDGYFGFNLKWMNNGDVNLHGDASNSITIQGNGKTDKILEVAENTYVKADESISMQILKNGLVEFGDKATWLGVSSYSFTNLMAVSKPYPQSGNGFWVSAVPNHTIQQITFKDLKYGLRAYLMWGNAANLKVSDCTFDHCFNAFSFFDKGVSLTNIDFINCTTPIVGTNASAPNYLSNVTIRDAGSSFQEAIKISGAGTSALYLQNCSIPNGPNGYYKKGIYLDGPFMTNVKCSNVYGGENSMYIYNNSSVNLSPLTADPTNASPLMRFGGNNNFKSGGGINAVSSNLLILQDGYNDFSVDGSSGKTETIYGTTFSFNTVNGNRFLPAHNNKWFDELYPYVTSPSQNNTGIALADLKKFGGGNAKINVIDNSPNHAACASNPSGGIPGVYNERGFPLEYCPKCPKINSDNFSDAPMNEAIQESLEESVDSINPDNLYDAFSMFYEIAATSTTYEENRVNWNSEFAYLKLKELFGSLAKENKLIPLDESNDYFIKLIEIEKRMIDISKEKDDDFHEFYYSVDMATTYRLIGKQEEALNILNNLAPCLRLKQEQVEFLNQWISIIQAEQLLKIGAIGIFDFDLYAGVTSGSNREFKKVGNTQANIDTVIVSSMQGLVPANTTLVQDNAGNTYSISNHMDSVSLNYHIQKSDAANVLQWEQDFDGRNRGVDSVRAILIDDNNFIYVTGKSWNGIDFDVLTVKFDTAGNRYWIAKYNDMEIGNDEPIAMEIDSNFKMKVYVRSFNDSVVKYKTIYYTQCDTNCAQNYRLRNVKNEEGKENLSNDAELTVYPIPATDKVNISLHSTDPAALYLLRMYDVSGKLVYSKTISYKYVLDLNPYAKGIYQLIISTKDKMLKQRIVKE